MTIVSHVTFVEGKDGRDDTKRFGLGWDGLGSRETVAAAVNSGAAAEPGTSSQRVDISRDFELAKHVAALVRCTSTSAALPRYLGMYLRYLQPNGRHGGRRGR
ncbi:hypothetical protein CPLU01_07227 [Colletotrichum plurivorum]|uniref:Uncharacterized protein n=1 Tax=Colletotrichum plurivorum TaxID=2175906 RepID=A0A8H6NEP8_9PEZI|nr:hypothetical protein CPLU01_07227 [Colletotrichum plurivorum]